MKNSIFLVAALVGVSLPVVSQTIYKSERNGVTVYSTSPGSNGQKVSLPELSVVPSTSHGSASPGAHGILPAVPVSSIPSNGLLPPPPPALGVLPGPVPSTTSPGATSGNMSKSDLEEQLSKAKADLVQQEEVRFGDERNYQKKLDRLKPYQEKVEALQKALSAIAR